MLFTLLAACPFWYKQESAVKYVGAMSSYAFTSLFFSFVLALQVSAMYLFRWETFQPVGEEEKAVEEGAAASTSTSGKA
jgi:hypothetical protein